MVQLLTPEGGSDDSELAHVDLSKIRTTYSHPHLVGHRSDLAGTMYEHCKLQKSVNFFFSTSAEEVKSFTPKPSFIARPRHGQPYEVQADVILAADGIKSTVRVQMLKALGVNAEIIDTGQAAYRIMLRREDMEKDPEMLRLIDQDRVTRWIGEKRHLIAYPVSNKSIYNISTTQPDEKNFAAAPSATYTTKGSKTAMLDTFSDFCPLIHRMLELVPDGEVCEWKLRVHARLPTWVHGNVALVGDSAHATLPHLNQGAAQAIEDAAVLAVVLTRSPGQDPSSINKSLQVYEQIRKDRAYTLVNLAAASSKTLHLGEGAAKEERDKQFEALKQKKSSVVPDKWADAEIQKMIYGHDCRQVAMDSFDDLYMKL